MRIRWDHLYATTSHPRTATNNFNRKLWLSALHRPGCGDWVLADLSEFSDLPLFLFVTLECVLQLAQTPIPKGVPCVRVAIVLCPSPFTCLSLKRKMHFSNCRNTQVESYSPWDFYIFTITMYPVGTAPLMRVGPSEVVPTPNEIGSCTLFKKKYFNVAYH